MAWRISEEEAVRRGFIPPPPTVTAQTDVSHTTPPDITAVKAVGCVGIAVGIVLTAVFFGLLLLLRNGVPPVAP